MPISQIMVGIGGEKPATEVTENTEAEVPSHLKANRLMRWLSPRCKTEESLCELCALCG